MYAAHPLSKKAERAQQPPAPIPRRPKRIVAGAVGFTLMLGVAYWVGRVDAGAKTQAVQAAAVEAAQVHEESKQALTEQIHTERRRIGLLEARRRIHLALIALDEHNFGIAGSELKSAGSLLSQIALERDGPLAKVAARLASYETVVTADLGKQRGEIVRFAKEIDAVLASHPIELGPRPVAQVTGAVEANEEERDL